jgi:hypothetical protein
MNTVTPFGYRYQGNICTIKLRFSAEKFLSLGIKEYGTFRQTRNMYVIFEAVLHTKSEAFAILSNKLRKPQPKPKRKKIQLEFNDYLPY